MNDNPTSDLNVLRLVIFALISISIVLLKCNRKIDAYLRHHFIWESWLNTICWLFAWYISNEFMEWWLSGIICAALALSFHIYIDKKFK